MSGAGARSTSPTPEAAAAAPSDVDVVVGVLVDATGRVLFGRRPAGKVYAGYWELPGGKVETGETLAAALGRELHEELGIDVERLDPWIVRTHAYAHARVRLHFFRVTRWRGTPHGRENQALAWQAPDDAMLAPMLPANGPVLAALALPDSYAISNAAELGREGFLAALDGALERGVRLVLFREPGMSDADRAELARRVVARCRPHRARVMVHADAALARAVGAEGVHYPARLLMTLLERPKDLLCAASCHDPRELAQASALEMDFAVLGPVLATQSHPHAATLGWDGLARLLAGSTLPVYAIGGMRPDALAQARGCGAQGVAMLRAVWQS